LLPSTLLPTPKIGLELSHRLKVILAEIPGLARGSAFAVCGEILTNLPSKT
jgi:hypothetical protein